MLLWDADPLATNTQTLNPDVQVPKEEVMEVSLWDADLLGNQPTNPKTLICRCPWRR